MVNSIQPSESEHPKQTHSLSKMSTGNPQIFLTGRNQQICLTLGFITSSVYTGFGFFFVFFFGSVLTGFNVTLKRITCKMNHCLQYLSFK